jgi:hypothetical protein
MKKKLQLQKKRNKKKVVDPLYYYIWLEDKMEFPSWFSKWNDGFLQLPLDQMKLEGDNLVWEYKGVHIGHDKNYVAVLERIGITRTIQDNYKFFMVLRVRFIVKPSRKKYIENSLKTTYLEYEVGCPIWQ